MKYIIPTFLLVLLSVLGQAAFGQEHQLIETGDLVRAEMDRQIVGTAANPEVARFRTEFKFYVRRTQPVVIKLHLSGRSGSANGFSFGAIEKGTREYEFEQKIREGGPPVVDSMKTVLQAKQIYVMRVDATALIPSHYFVNIWGEDELLRTVRFTVIR